MNYDEALNYIHSTLKFGIKLGLENIKSLLELMDNPHKKLKYVHVAGTNGKGSVVSFISRILMESGYKTGMYTSPYIERFTERIKINNIEISKDNLARITDYVKSKIEILINRGGISPTEFEIITAIAFQYFYEMNCDIVVLEVGLGGRLDATNVIDTPLVSIITSISYDHMDKLGDTLPKIAFEKAGIIKENSDVILYPQCQVVERVFEEVCNINSSKLYKINLESLVLENFNIYGQKFNYKEKLFDISLLGDHQIKNALVALEAASIIQNKGYILINELSIRKGLENTKWQGRFEVINHSPIFLIDGAHNKEGSKALADTLEKYFPGKRKIFILGILKDKDVNSVIENIVPIAYKFITITPNNDRAMSAYELAQIIRNYSPNVFESASILNAVKMSLDIASHDDLICAFGSLYYIGQIKSIINMLYST